MIPEVYTDKPQPPPPVCYINPMDYEDAETLGMPKKAMARVPRGRYFILLKGGANAPSSARSV